MNLGKSLQKCEATSAEQVQKLSSEIFSLMTHTASVQRIIYYCLDFYFGTEQEAITEKRQSVQEWKKDQDLKTAENYKDPKALQEQMDAENKIYEADDSELTEEQRVLRQEKEKLDEWIWLFIKFLMGVFANSPSGEIKGQNSAIGMIFDVLNSPD